MTKPWYDRSRASIANSDPALSEPIIKKARETPTRSIPVTPHIKPGTMRRYSLYRTALDAAAAIIDSNGSHFWDRDGEQETKSRIDSAA